MEISLEESNISLTRSEHEQEPTDSIQQGSSTFERAREVRVLKNILQVAYLSQENIRRNKRIMSELALEAALTTPLNARRTKVVFNLFLYDIP